MLICSDCHLWIMQWSSENHLMLIIKWFDDHKSVIWLSRSQRLIIICWISDNQLKNIWWLSDNNHDYYKTFIIKSLSDYQVLCVWLSSTNYLIINWRISDDYVTIIMNTIKKSVASLIVIWRYIIWLTSADH